MICAEYGCDYQLDIDGQVTCVECGAMDDDMISIDIKNERTEKCYYCKEAAKYDDTIQGDQGYFISGVCEKHSFKGLIS